jgi:hypothetical protein
MLFMGPPKIGSLNVPAHGLEVVQGWELVIVGEIGAGP